ARCQCSASARARNSATKVSQRRGFFHRYVLPSDALMLRERLAAQGLSGAPAGAPEEVVGRILAVQAQDLKAARLALRARSKGFETSAIDRALTEDRSLVVSWLNRGTLHLVRAEDVGWLHELTAPRQTTNNLRRLAEEGVSPTQGERGV